MNAIELGPLPILTASFERVLSLDRRMKDIRRGIAISEFALACSVLFACAMAVCGCARNVFVYARHAPFFLEQPHSSQIVANAWAPDGLEHINIVVIAGSAAYCPSDADVPSPIPCRTGATAQGTSCFFAQGVTTGSCSITQPIQPYSIVTYKVQAKSTNGRITNLSPITYSGGERLVGYFCWFKWGFLPILECADSAQLMPIWWQTDEPSGGSNDPDRIDISFNRDADFQGNVLAFSNMLEPMIRRAYFNTAQQFGTDYTYSRHWFTLWSGPDGADRDSCAGGFSFGATAKAATTYTDGEVVIHDNQNIPRACANITYGGSGWMWGNDPQSAETFVHESGHMLYALGDEYCCDGGYGSNSTPRNVHPSQAACETVATSIGVSKSLCVRIEDPPTKRRTDFWRITDGQLEIMAESWSFNSDWRDASDLARMRQISECSSGNCY
jgi:hypothetical protein